MAKKRGQKAGYNRPTRTSKMLSQTEKEKIKKTTKPLGELARELDVPLEVVVAIRGETPVPVGM